MASGNTLAVFLATDGIPPISSYASLDTRGAVHFVLDFDGTADQEIQFHGVLPSTYGGGGLTVTLWVAFSAATSGNSRWQADIERIQAGTTDLDLPSFTGTFQSVGIAAPAGSSGIVATGDIVFTAGAAMDGLLAGEAFRLLIRRDADGTSGTDDITSDAELLRVVIKET
jgi:hypothetical protein